MQLVFFHLNLTRSLLYDKRIRIDRSIGEKESEFVACYAPRANRKISHTLYPVG